MQNGRRVSWLEWKRYDRVQTLSNVMSGFSRTLVVCLKLVVRLKAGTTGL